MHAMSNDTASVVHDASMTKVLPHKREDPPKESGRSQFKFVWPDDLIAEVKELAEVSDRSINEAGEILMRWAVQEARAEWGLSHSASEAGRTGRKKQQD